MKKILKKIIMSMKIFIMPIKLFIMSLNTSFCLTFGLIMINAIMGIQIGLNYYLSILTVLSLGLTIGLLLFNSKAICSKKKVNKIEKTKESKRKQFYSNEIRRKIS